mmetsp:Transcript_9007/g.8405  ORF Transcript_9007/g.8405 Transcript_9007/m.8405 type:complete len:84 (+) Transcript_9007:574-825(+)
MKTFCKLNLNLGSFDVNYTNEILQALFDFMVGLKEMPAFRDVNFVGLASGRKKTSAHRKVELMMPFYIVRKLVENHQGDLLRT